MRAWKKERCGKSLGGKKAEKDTEGGKVRMKDV
jgi:hypothetical protein